jgi:outer membrane protein, heavy metal efflux system
MTTPILRVGCALLFFSTLAYTQPADRLTVDQAIALALSHNEQILTAQKEDDAAEGRILQAGRIPNPDFGISWQFPADFALGNADERVLSISQQIEFPTKRSSRVDVATYDKEITSLLIDRARTLISARVRIAYYSALLGQEIVRSLEGQLSLLRDFQQLVTSRFQAGASSYLDVVRSKVEVARTGNDLTDARRELLLRTAQLNLLLGREGDRAVILADTLVAQTIPLNQDSVVTRLMERSAALRAARRMLDRQQSAINAAKAAYYPDLTVGFSALRQSEQAPFNANNFTGVTTNSYGIQLGLSVPLWFWQEQRGQVREAEALSHIAMVRAGATERRVRSSILHALRTVAVLDTQLQVFDSSLMGDARDILATGIAQYRNNSIDVLNLVDIYRTYRATNVEYARTVTNYYSALADLDAAGEQILELE